MGGAPIETSGDTLVSKSDISVIGIRKLSIILVSLLLLSSLLYEFSIADFSSNKRSHPLSSSQMAHLISGRGTERERAESGAAKSLNMSKKREAHCKASGDGGAESL